VNDAPVLSTNGGKAINVDHVSYKKHFKLDRPQSLRVTYWNGLEIAAEEWVCMEHPPGYARNKALSWLKRRGLEHDSPTVDYVLEHSDTLIVPKMIAVQKKGRYHNITGYVFND